MKTEELRGKTPDQLSDLLKEAKKELFNLRFQKVSGELQNTARFKIVKRNVARIKTIINEQKKKAA